MAQIFAYIAHKNGVVEDSAAELAVAAKKIDAAAQVTAIVTGSGSTLDSACQSAANQPGESVTFSGFERTYAGMESGQRCLGLPQRRSGAQTVGQDRSGRQHRFDSP